MSDSLSDITDLSELSPSTTTISTVAVQSGRSKVVLAILRGAEWIRVRVHQMEPDLMDVGSTLEEALQYQREHNEMLAKLKAKEDEVKKILCSADSYVTENPSQADVYSAMADTLSEAWRELNKKLEARSLLLEESVEFHKSAHEFSSKMEQAQGKISTSVPTHDVETARHLLQQHQEIKTGILEASKSTLNQGHTLLTRIREMGMHADLQNRHATTAACYGIEHLLELLQDRRRRLEDIWEQRRIRLEQCFQLCQLDMEVNKVLDWYRTVGSSYLQKTELGDSFHQVQLLQEDHYRFETQAKHIQQTVVRLVRDADQLLRRANMDAEGVRRRLQTVDRECEDFRNKLDTRRKNIMMAASFFDQAETALTKLDQVEVQLNSMDLPRNSAALADRHAQLSNAIVEASTQAQREGRILLERVSRDDPGADGVRRRMTLLQERCAGLESLCKARRAEAWERSQAYLQFQEHFNSLQTWLTSIGQSTLSQHADMGTRLETAEDFLEIHEQLDQDLRDKNAELEALFEAGVNLVKSGDQEAQTAAGKVDTLHKQMQKLHRIVEVRIQLSLVYLSFHKLVQQLTTSMSGLEHIMTSETENLQDLTDQAMRHTEEMYNKLNELYNDVQEKGRLFFQNSSAVKDDSTLNIKESVLTVERTITEYSERMTYIKTVWESWQQKVSTSRQFKSQWHQFVQDARKTIDKVMATENEFFYPNLAGYLGNSTASAEDLQKKIDAFTPTFKSAIEDLDKHLSTAELMEMKGDTKGQKDMIVNELVKVRQRFQARIHEYRILIKMTIQFFRNLDQLDKLIEKTEKEYTQSELPSDLSQAESMLEEHKRKQKEVSSLINFTSGEGEKIVVRVRQTDAEAAAQEDVERVLKVTAEYKQRWNQAWEDQEKRLKQNLQICQFNYDLRQIHSEIDDLHHHLQARRGSYGNSLPAARMTSQAFKQFEMTVQLIEKKIGMFTSTAQVMVQDQHYDAVHIGREIDLLKTKWSTFHTSVGNYRMLLDVSITYFTLIEESEQWIREGNTLLINISRRVPECRNPEEAETLARSLNSFMESGKPRQEDRLKHISELAIELYGDEGPAKVHQLFVTNQDLMMSAQQMDTEIAKVHQNLTQAQMAPPVHEDVVPMEVTVTASAAVAKQPPKITLHLKDAEVMEGEKVTLECQVQSDLPPEVTWYKDNMPLNSPDYETKFNLGRATLTIEETFSEDTARYTCRFTSQTGVAESSSYLHVRALEKPVIHSMSEDVNIPEGKSVKLEIIFSGSPTPEVTWYRNEDRISPSSVYKITIELNRSVLEITEAYTEDSGTYKVTLQNTAGETHRSCQVNVENFYSSAAEEMSIASLEAEPQKPSFVQPLAPAREVMEGSRVRLDCVITGHPEPEVIWFRKDKPVKESKDIQLLFEGDRCTLSIREAYLEDSGLYRCLARNQHGEAESTCKLHVEPLSELSDASCGEVAAPKFTQLLRDLSIPIGHRVCLQCRVTGHPVPDIQWYKDNKLIENSPDYQVTAFADVHNLTIPETFEEDTGNYMVRATNLAGEAKCYAKLSVKAPPEPIQEAEVMRLRRVVETKESNMIVKRDDGLEQSPPEFQKLFQDMTVSAGDNVTFECTITGSPKPKVTWYFNGEPVVSRDYQISMEVNTYRLHIPEVFDEDAGRFSITAENPSGKATCSACLNVDEEPTIPKTRIFGNTEMLSKRVSRTETTMTKTHVKHIYQSTQQPDTYIPSYESHSTTILTDVSDAEPVPVIGTTEHYATTIKTDVPPTFKPVDLTIAVPIPPKFLQPLKNITAAEGSKVVFEGVVSGKPEPTIKWFREGKQLTDKADFEIGYRDGRVSLTIPEVFEEDAGRFECQADNEGGQATSSSQLVVRATMIPPKFTEKLKITETREGQAVRFMVRVSGQPPPTVTWYRNGAQIVSSRDFEIVTEGDLHTLYIPEVFQEDGGTFTVTAENPAGHAQCTTELRILAPMEQVPAPVYKPVTAVRETFDQRRAPPREAPKPFEPTEEPSAKVPKLQRPSQFVTRPEPKPQMFSEQIEMQVDSKPRLAPFEKRIELFKEPAPEEEIPPPLPTSKPPVFVTTKEKPVFTQMLKNVSVCEGERVVFECRVSAHPEPIIKWYRETVIITSSPDYEITWDNNTARLTIAEIFPEDAGVFKCVATNAEGSATSEARLVVKPATPEIDVPITEEPIRHVQAPKRDEKVPAMTPIRPQFTDKPGNSRLVEATNTIFECHVTGVPFPEITWKKRGFPLRTDKRHRTTVDPLSGRCSLTISHCRPDDAGEYTCTAVNLAGEDTVTANLLPAEARAPSPPPPPMPSIPVAPLKSWKPVSAEPRETQVPVQEPVTRKPWEPVQVQKQQPVSAPPQTWEPSMTELRARMEAPQRHPQEFVVTRAEKILESNLQYRLSKEPEEKKPPPVQDFQSVGFEQRLMSENYMRDGHIKISSETETSEYESELQDDRGPPAPPASPAIVQKLKDFRLIEGSDATFVCRVTGRPRPKIAWYKNGHRIKRSNRYEMKYTKDGYCTLRIRIALPEDAGHFTILAVNASGKATCSSMLYVDSVGQIDSTSFVAPTTLEKIASKDKAKSQKPEDQSGILEALVRPTFKKIPESLQAREGQTVRLDTVVSGRPAPELTWYRDGQPVRNDNNHKTVVNEDGVNSLIILSSTRYDAGTYMCVAKSKAGENSFNVIVSILEKEMLQPPKFLNRMPNVTAKAGEPITLTCDVSGTPTPMISWQKDGKMLVPSNPYRIDIEGNRSTLYIERCEPSDSAWFQCSAINVAGSASTRAKIQVPVEMPKPEPVKKFTVPKVTSPAQVAPKPSQVVPKVAPQVQTKPVRMPGSQSPPHYDIQSEGLVQQISYSTEAGSALMRLIKEEDAARITTKAHITPSTPPMVPLTAPIAAPPTAEEPMEEEETVLPENVADAKRRFETPEKSLPPVGKPPKAPIKHVASPKPVAPLRPSPKPVAQEPMFRPEAVKRDEVPPVRVQPPTQSPIRHVEAPRTKEPSPMAARQDVLPIPPGVPGAYDIQSEGPVQMITYVSDTEAGYLRLVSEDELDSSRSRSVSMERPRLPLPKPRTLAVLSSTEEESDRYEDKPKHEPQLPASLQTKYKQFRPVKPPQQRKKKKSKTPSPPKEQPPVAPAPVFVPQVAPKPPQVAPAPPFVPKVFEKPQQVAMFEPRADDQHESAVREYIRREGEAPAQEDIYDKHKPKKPWFKTQIKNLMGLKENDSAHFECKLLPLGDPTMEIEWFKDGKPLHHGHRFKHMHDFGFVCLDILYTYPEDSGEYSCTARNSQGEATTTALLKCRGRRSIIMDTQLPGEGAMRLQEMEEYWRSNMYLEERTVDEPRERFPPSIDLKPEPVETGEGEVAKFMIKVSGYPRPRVNWWVNGTVIIGSTRFKLRYDGMIHHLEIPRVREYDGGQIRVVAKNTEGEAEASTTLNVVPKEDWRSRLRQAPKGELEIELERRRKIEMRSVELVTAMEKPKPTTVELKQIERAAEKRVVMRQEKEVMNAEQLYMSVASKPTMRELPARVVRADRPEIQVDIQKARMVPVIPEQTVPDESKISETQIVLERREPPVFTKPLRPVRVTEGNPVTLEVQFKGHPAPIISWYRDSFEIKPSHDFQISVSETVSTLFIPEVFPEDTGMYMVKAYNMYGTVQCKAKMTVIEEESPERDIPPEFRSLIRDSNVVQGEPATFDCQVSGRPKPKIHWQKDGKPLSESPRWKFIEEDNNFTMVIYEVVPEDVGQYDCVAINTVGKATCTARLNVEVPIKPSETEEQKLAEAPVEPPVVTERPQNLEVDEGEPVTFTSRITGSPPPNVTWYRNNVIIKPSKYFRMESTLDGTHSLSILEAFPEDTGLYRCVARNKAGEVTCSATLKVHALESEAEAPVPAQKDTPPQFTKPISNTLVVEGSPATFEAEYSGTPEPTITWLRNSLQVLQDSTNYKIERTTTKTILTIREARPEDSGLITCRIKNIAGTTECSAELYVQDTEEARLLEEKYITTIKTTPPEFVKALSPVQDVQPGGTARLYASINAYPPPKYQWYTKGVQIVPSERRQMIQEDNAIILIIINVQEEDSGDYILKVENDMGEVTCRTTLTVRGKTQYVAMPPTDTETLTIRETTTMVTREERFVTEMIKPELIEPLEPEIYVRERGIAKLQCKVDSYPPPLVTWFVNGMEIRPSPHYEMMTEEGNSVLLIIEVGPEDTGEYTCRAVSELGEVMSSTTLYVQEPVTKEMPAVPKRPEETVSLEPSPSEELTPPRFVEMLPSMETYDGEEVKIPCRVVGKPPPQVSFFHNGKNIDHDEEYVVSYNPDTGEIHLLIVEVFPEDEGEYVCVASNPAGEASTRAYLTVLAPEDSIDAAPMEVEVVAQVIDRPKVEPLVKEEPPVSPPPEKPMRMEVTEVKQPEEPMEEVQEEVTEQVTKPQKIEREKKIPLEPERAPESPERTVTVSVEKKPAPKPEEKHTEVCEATLKPEAITRKFEIPDVKPVDEHVDKEDSVIGEEKPPQKEEVVSQFTLEEAQEVTEIPPEFVELLQPQMIPDGDEVTMICRVEGTPFPTVTWYRERQEITPSTDFKITTDETTGVCTLNIPEVFPEDAGEYACRAINPFGEAVTTATLLVHTMPEDEEPEDVTVIEEKHVTKIEKSPEFVRPLNPVLDVEEDQTARLEVEVVGEPRPKVTWYVNEIRLMPTPRVQIIDERTTSTLVITKVVPSDSQDYICVAENDRGVVTCKTTLHVTPKKKVEFALPREERPKQSRPETVKYPVSEDETGPSASEDELPEEMKVPPIFTELLQPKVVRDGERVEFLVHFRGTPQPKVKWFQNGHELKPSTDFQITVDFNRGQSSLVIVEVFPEDEGEYTCSARNRYGETITTCRLTVVAPEEEIPEHESHRMTIEVQQVPKPQEVTHDIHTTELNIQQEQPVDTPIDITEETRFKESIELDRKAPIQQQPQSITVVKQPIVTHPVTMVTQQGTIVTTEPTTQVEIQIGFPQQPQPMSTSSVTTETTTYTTTKTTHEVVDVEDYPSIVEGGEFHKTSMVVTAQEEPQPLKLVEIQQLPREDVVSETTRMVTKEIHTIPQEPEEVSESEERHSETIEIVPDTQPQEVQFEIKLPEQQTVTTEKKITTQTQQERRTSVQKYEVEIQEKFMVQKPHEIHIPLKSTSEVEFDVVDGAEPKDLPRPTEEQIEEVRPSFEVEKKPEPVVEEEIPKDEKPKQEVSVEFPVKETPIEETPIEETPVKEAPVEDTPVEETPVKESSAEDTPVKTVEISIPVSEETKQEIETFVTETEVQKTDIIDAEETHFEEVTFDLKGRPKEEVTFSIDIQKEEPVEDVPIKETTLETTHQEEITFQLSEQPQEVVVDEVTETEETHIEEVTFDLKGKPLEEVTFSISSTEETTPKEVEALEESVPEEQVLEVEIEAPAQPVITTERETIQVTELEAETPAPLQPVEVTQRAVIEHVKEPESETEAPEDFLEISQRETIEIIREPEETDEVVQIDIDIAEQLPEVTTVTETEETRTTKEVTFELPQVEDSYEEEMVIQVQKEPTQEVQLTLQVEQTEQSAPEVEEVVRDVEVIKEQITEVIQLPEVEEEITLQVEDRPEEAVELTLHISDSNITEIEETTSTEKSENIEEEFVFQLPAVTESTTEEVMLEVEDKPSEEVIVMDLADQEIEVPESDAPVPVEQVTMETEEVFQLPVLQQEEDKEVVMDTEETPGEEVQFSIDLSVDSGPVVLEEVTETRTSRTEEITTQEISTVDDSTTEEITLQIEDIPEEEYEMTIQLGDETETSVIEQVTTTEEVSEEPQSFTFQVAEVEESTPEEIQLQVEETPGEEVEITLQVSDDQEAPLVLDAQESETMMDTTQEVTFQVSDLGDTTTEEVTVQLTEQPQEEIELTLQMPEHVKEVTKIIVTEEETTKTTEEKITVPEATTTKEVFSDIEIPEGDLAPNFTWGLTSLKVMDGEEAKFRCEVEGHPMPEISWYHDDKPITENQDFKLTYNTESGACTLLIVEVFPQDAGEYTCVAINKYGKAITRGYLEVESYEYVPDTEEASDSFLSSIEAASPKPHVDSDSELSTVAKEFEEQIQKVKEKMEIEILEAKEEPAQPQEVEIQAGTVETTEVEETEEVAPIMQEPQPEEAKPLDVTAEAVQSTAVAPVESVAETTDEVVPTSEEVVLISQEPQPEEAKPLDVTAEAVKPESVAPEESITETTQEVAPASEEVVPITLEPETEKVKPEDVEAEAVQPKAISPVESITDSTQEVAPAQEDVVPVAEEPQTEEAKPEEVPVEVVEPKASSPVESITDATQEVAPAPEDVVPVTEEPQSEEATQLDVTVEAVQPKAASPVESITETTQEVAPAPEDVVPVSEEPQTEEAKPEEVPVETVQPEAITPVESITEVTQEVVSTSQDVSITEEPQPEETRPVEVTTESVTTTEVITVQSVTDTTEEVVEISEVSEVTAPQEEVPVFVTPLSDMQVTEGTTVRFEVNFTGTPAPEVAWFLENEELLPSEDIEITTQERHSVLVLQEVFPEDEGQYIVEVTNLVGKATSTAYLHVTELVKPAKKEEAPIQEAPTQVEEVTPEETVEVKVTPEETTQPSEIPTETIEIEVVTPGVSEATTQEVTEITEVTDVITVEEEDVPAFVSQLNEMHVTEHTTIKFDVSFTGIPETVTWFLDGEEIEPSEEMEIVTKEQHSVLMFHDVFPEDEGEYSIEVVTKKGTIKSTAYLHVHEVTKKPVQPTTAPTTEESLMPEETVEITMETEEKTTSSEITTEVSTAVVETRRESKVPTTEETLPEEETGSLVSVQPEEPKTSDIEMVGATPSEEAPKESKTAPAEETMPEEETAVVESPKPEEPATTEIEDVGATPSEEAPKETETVPAEEILPEEKTEVVESPKPEEPAASEIEDVGATPSEEAPKETETAPAEETLPEEETEVVESVKPEEPATSEVEVVAAEPSKEAPKETETAPAEETLPEEETEVVESVKPEEPATSEVEVVAAEPSKEAPKETETAPAEETLPEEETKVVDSIQVDEPKTSEVEVIDATPLKEEPKDTETIQAVETLVEEDVSTVTEVTEQQTTPADVEIIETTPMTITVEQTKVTVQQETVDKSEVTEVKVPVTQETVPVEIEFQVSKATSETIVTKTEIVKEATQTVEIEMVPEEKPETETPIQVQEVSLEIAKKVETIETEEVQSPRFTTSLTDITIMENNVLHLEVVFTAKPAPQVTWFLDGEPLKPNEDIEIVVTETTSTFIIKDAYPEDEGEYWVDVTNKAGTARSTAYICILPLEETKPVQTVQKSVEVSQQEVVTMGFEVSEKVIETKSVEEVSTVEIQVKTETQETVAQAVITEESQAPKVEEGVTEAPRFIQTLQQQVNVHEGSTVTVECVVTGTPTPEVMWFQDDEELRPDDHYVTEYHTGVCRLTIQDIYLDDEAIYKCEATNEHGVATTTIEIFVENYVNAAECVTLHEEHYEIEIEMEIHWKKRKGHTQITTPLTEKSTEPLKDQLTDHMIITRPDEPWDITVRQAHRTHSV